jgi:hypothetical protein
MDNHSAFLLLVSGLMLIVAAALLIYATQRRTTEVDICVKHSPNKIDELVASIFPDLCVNKLDSTA